MLKLWIPPARVKKELAYNGVHISGTADSREHCIHVISLQQSAGLSELILTMLTEFGAIVVNRPVPCVSKQLEFSRSRFLMREVLERLRLTDINAGQAAHLLGTAHCLLGEIDAARNLYESDRASSYSLVQLAVLVNQAGEAERSAQLLDEANLNQQEAVELISFVIEQMSGLDWSPHLRLLVTQYPQNERLWRFWLVYGDQLGKANQWSEVLDWYQSGTMNSKKPEGVYFMQCVICTNRAYLPNSA